MATRAVQMTVCYAAWDTVANAGKTGDSGNHTLRWVKDGTSSAPTNAASEVDATNAPGVYKITLTSTETDCDIGVLAGKSSTASVSLIPLTIQFERLPNAAPGASGGVLISGTNTGNVTITGSLAVTAGVAITQSTTNGHGLAITGNGAGAGVVVTGGATGYGLFVTASAADGVRLNSGSVGYGLRVIGVAGDIEGDISGNLSWNAAWDTEIQSEVADALNAYDPPTKAELDAAVADVSVDEIQASALADLFNTDSGTDYASAVAGSVVKEIADNAGGSSLTAGDIADAVLDEALSGHTTAGTLGKAIADIESDATAILVDTAEIGAAGAGLTNINLPDQTMNITGNITGNLSGSVGSVTGDVAGNVTGSVGSLATQAKADVNAEADAAIETYHLDHLLAATYDPASKPGAADALLNELIESDGGVSRFTANALEEAPAGGGGGDATEAKQDTIIALIGTPAADIAADIAAVKTQTAAIEADTQDLQTQVGTDGAGLTNIPWNASWDAEVQSEVEDGLAAYDPPTNAELEARTLVAANYATAANLATVAGYLDTEIAAILEDTGTTLPAQIAALNNLSAAQVNTEVDAALADYDGPTHAELVSEINAVQADIAALSIPSANNVADAVLSRDVSNVEGSAPEHCLATIVLAGLESSVSGTTWTIKRTDGSTTHATKTVTTTEGADPITGVS